MQIIFSKNNTIASRLIRAVTGECVSHCGLWVGEYILHSNFLGVRITRSKEFLLQNTIVLSVKRPDNYPRILQLVCKYHKAKYDFGALLYLLLALLGRYLYLPVPKQNLWQSTGMFLCTEWVALYEEGKEDHMVTPYKLYLKLVKETK